METGMPLSPMLYKYTSLSPTNTDASVAGTPIKSEEGNSGEPPKKKQKRNKPTLSCEECVERKTKCDRGRPHCLACIKRQTECKYALVADMLEETARSPNGAPRMTKPPRQRSSVVNGFQGPKQVLHPPERTASRGSTTTTFGLLSHVPYSHPSASNVFGIGSEHPFSNYWTHNGGMPEVISVLPDKGQADILLDRYFDCVDPVYPMIHRQTFYAEYDNFWTLPSSRKDQADGALIALIFAMLAMGTQFVSPTAPKERQQTAEFYVSAAHQGLRMGSYLNKTSIRSIQAMVLITYFLINDNHASDGWAFAGILIRQAYAMGLHRDPDRVCPNATPFEKQVRRKLWQAVLLQDTFLTVLLALPPSATHTDVSVSGLVPDSEVLPDPPLLPVPTTQSSNPMSIQNINAPFPVPPPPPPPPPPNQPTHSGAPDSDPELDTDTAYLLSSWHLANLVQESICSPRSLDLPIAPTPRSKSKLLSSFRSIHRNLPPTFRLWTPSSLSALALTNSRVVRQTLFLTSNYHHNVMLLHTSESEEVKRNVRGALEAAHEAMGAFFLLWELFESEAKVWWVFNHRAFIEAQCVGDILNDVAAGKINNNVAARGDGKSSVKSEKFKIEEGEGENGERDGDGNGKAEELVMTDPLFSRAKADILRMISIMRFMGEGEHGSEVALTRVSVLSHYL